MRHQRKQCLIILTGHNSIDQGTTEDIAKEFGVVFIEVR